MADTRKLRFIGYLRVSTDKQAEEGNGLAVQEAAIRKWAQDNGHKITEWTRDEGESGSNGLETRTGLGSALNTIRDHGADGIVVYRLDRLARDVILQEQLLKDIRSWGGTLASTVARENDVLADDDADPSRKLIRVILGAVADYERELIKLRMLGGKTAKRARGGYAGFGSPAFGQRSVDAELVTDEREAAVIARMRELRAEGMGYTRIAGQLNAEGLKSKRGGNWHTQTVARVLERLSA